MPRKRYFRTTWKPAASWWGPGLDRAPLELDVVAESEDGSALLIGEAKWSDRDNLSAVMAELERKVERFPLAGGHRVHLALFTKARPERGSLSARIFGPGDVVTALR